VPPAKPEAIGDAMTLRILLLAPQPFFVERGTPIAVRALMEALSRLGCSVDALVLAGGRDVAIERCAVFRTPRLPGGPVAPGFSLRKLAADALLAPMAARRLMSGRYDLVIAVEEAAYIAAALQPIFGVPYVYDMDSSIPEQINDKRPVPRWLLRLLESAERLALRRSAGVIACCRALEDLARLAAPGVPTQTLEDVSLVEPGEPAADCVFDEPVVMYVGNLEPYQGVELLVDGFARVRAPSRLVIIGGAPEHAQTLAARARALGVGDRVSLLGPRPVDRLGSYLARATIVASPRTQGRNTPMKVYSYLDSGRPLLATRLPTHTQVLDDSIAMLVEPTADGIADGLERLLADAGLRDRLASAAATRVREEHSPEAYERKLRDFLMVRLGPKLAAAAGRAR
jgi:glycosyltransferase involved in cell wall biosynthesis